MAKPLSAKYFDRHEGNPNGRDTDVVNFDSRVYKFANAYAAYRVNEALEMAAQLCEKEMKQRVDDAPEMGDAGYAPFALMEMARRIRAMKETV